MFEISEIGKFLINVEKSFCYFYTLNAQISGKWWSFHNTFVWVNKIILSEIKVSQTLNVKIENQKVCLYYFWNFVPHSITNFRDSFHFPHKELDLLLRSCEKSTERFVVNTVPISVFFSRHTFFSRQPNIPLFSWSFYG